jgi:hypothetical protein
MIRRVSRMAAVVACSASILSAVACTSAKSAPPSASTSAASSPAPSATDSYQARTARQDRLFPVFVQCLAQHDIPIWARSVGNVNVAAQGSKGGWYADGKVIQNDAFYEWLEQHDGMYPISPALKPDQTIVQWVENAAINGTWPTKACGAMPKQ